VRQLAVAQVGALQGAVEVRRRHEEVRLGRRRGRQLVERLVERRRRRRQRLGGGAAVAIGVAEAFRHEGAQQEHEQPVVLAHAAAGALAVLVEHRLVGAVDGALEGDVEQPLRGMLDGDVPGLGEGSGVGRAAQPVAGIDRHLDRFGRDLDAAGVGEGGDELDLPLRRPAVLAGFAEHGDPFVGFGIAGDGIAFGAVIGAGGRRRRRRGLGNEGRRLGDGGRRRAGGETGLGLQRHQRIVRRRRGVEGSLEGGSGSGGPDRRRFAMLFHPTVWNIERTNRKCVL
jgi:hypothetical protein